MKMWMYLPARSARQASRKPHHEKRPGAANSRSSISPSYEPLTAMKKDKQLCTA